MGENKRVWLGGTFGKWRQDLKKLLKIGYWENDLDDDLETVIADKKNCDYILYTLTPSMTGIFSFEEIKQDTKNYPERIILCALNEEDKNYVHCFDLQSWEVVQGLAKEVTAEGGKYFEDIKQLADYLNDGGRS